MCCNLIIKGYAMEVERRKGGGKMCVPKCMVIKMA